jgi:hypothetical protein
MAPFTDVTLEDIPCMCVLAEGGVSGSKVAFDKLESKLSSLKSRKFYGVVLNGAYRACVALQEGDDPEKSGLDTYTIPAGKYLRATINEWCQNLDKIGPTFDEMSNKRGKDTNRPLIEFYRSRRELILLMPVL